eukprot:6187434-Pleurochrysis_carterae.AAC.3
MLWQCGIGGVVGGGGPNGCIGGGEFVGGGGGERCAGGGRLNEGDECGACAVVGALCRRGSGLFVGVIRSSREGGIRLGTIAMDGFRMGLCADSGERGGQAGNGDFAKAVLVLGVPEKAMWGGNSRGGGGDWTMTGI